MDIFEYVLGDFQKNQQIFVDTGQWVDIFELNYVFVLATVQEQ